MKKTKPKDKEKCRLWREDNKCHSNYGKKMKCDGLNTPKKCPWKGGGSYAMAVDDAPNKRRTKRLIRKSTVRKIFGDSPPIVVDEGETGILIDRKLFLINGKLFSIEDICEILEHIIKELSRKNGTKKTKPRRRSKSWRW